MNRIDLVTVFHNETNWTQHFRLLEAVNTHEPDGGFTFFAVDNRVHNRGFSAGCNLGAFHPRASAKVIGFLNPDCEIEGPFVAPVLATLGNEVVITGCRFSKPQRELNFWHVKDWVCGAAMFVSRSWFASVGGFDEQFTFGFDETDLIRQAEVAGKACKSIYLPIRHNSPQTNSDEDAAYKRYHFAQGSKRYAQKWGP